MCTPDCDSEKVTDWEIRNCEKRPRVGNAGEYGVVQHPQKSKNAVTTFYFEGDAIDFSINRHAVGREAFQHWRFKSQSDELIRVQERLLKADFEVGENGEFLRPRCRGRIDAQPGRVRCLKCSYEIQHEHTLFSRFP